MTDDRDPGLPLWQRLGENNISDAALFREFGDIPAVPALVKVIRRQPAPPPSPGSTYEEANWAHLSPAFRAAHNRLRRQRGLSPISEPEVDLYVPPKAAVRPFDPSDREVIAAARGFVGPAMLGERGGEGFTINGQPVNGAVPIRSGSVPAYPASSNRQRVADLPPPQAGHSTSAQEGREGDELFPGRQFPDERGGQGFTINGKAPERLSKGGRR